MKLNVYLDSETEKILNYACSIGFNKSSFIRTAVRFYFDYLEFEDVFKPLLGEQGLDTNRSEYISSEKK